MVTCVWYPHTHIGAQGLLIWRMRLHVGSESAYAYIPCVFRHLYICNCQPCPFTMHLAVAVIPSGTFLSDLSQLLRIFKVVLKERQGVGIHCSQAMITCWVDANVIMHSYNDMTESKACQSSAICKRTLLWLYKSKLVCDCMSPSIWDTKQSYR